LHGEVSRRLFLPLFPRWPEDEIPIGYVTNGVHMPTWDSAPADHLWTETCKKDRWLGTTTNLEQDIYKVSDARLWQFRTDASKSLVAYARARLSRDLTAAGAPPQDVEAAKHLFDPNALTLGFARRFATYKRPNLLLHDPQRLLRILTNSQRPVQLVMAGKAHPADQAGQDLIREWMHFIRQPETRPHAIFLSDYDMLLTEHLVQGVDVWINTPRRPWEASGTSGMKVLVNGGLNLSELDGWWAEAYTPEVGWALGDGREHGDDPSWDAAEAEALYGLGGAHAEEHGELDTALFRGPHGARIHGATLPPRRGNFPSACGREGRRGPANSRFAAGHGKGLARAAHRRNEGRGRRGTARV
jgi:starch phosphorylase